MPSRDFIITPAGEELTIDRNSAGWEQTCALCLKVIDRREPCPPDELEQEKRVSEDRYTLGLRIDRIAKGANASIQGLNLELCKPCAAVGLAPFLAAMAALRWAPATEMVDDLVDELARQIETGDTYISGAQAVGDAIRDALKQNLGGDVDEDQGDVDEHQGDELGDVGELADTGASESEKQGDGAGLELAERG